MPATATPLIRPPAIGRVTASALPQDRLHFGITNSPADFGWMAASGVPWRYRYQYLAGGVNTPGRWETWQDPALPPGQFAIDYINQSHGAGITPVLTYYELLQSTPSVGGDEATRDYNNLNNASTMAAYYSDWKILMQRAAAAGGTTLVHVEPDLWGYLENRAGNGAQPASSLSASVASSGNGDVQGLPNTAQGFAFALLKMRDTYAPNVLLGIHASPWGTNRDIGADTDPSLDVAAIGDSTATFLNSAGTSSNPYGTTWDVVFNDLDDHDAGWWEQNGRNHWWDPTNATVPNFSRYLTWVAHLHSGTARPQMAWQVPVGNQYYLTMNNTCGHYQDNVAEYFLAYPQSLSDAGLIAVLFGGGNACTTQATDAVKDGVTNNNGVPTSDGPGRCNACNTHTATVTDDDGGFLRTFVGAYYAGVPPPPPARSRPIPLVPGNPGSPPPFAVAGADASAWVSSSGGQFAPLSGILTGAPAVISLPGASNHLIIAAGADHDVWVYSEGFGWEPFSRAPVYCLDNPAAAMVGSNLLVACQGGDHSLWYAQVPVTTSVPPLGAWSSLGGALGAGPAVAPVGGQALFAVVDPSGAPWMRTIAGPYSSTPWRCVGHPALVTSGATNYFACHGLDGALWWATWSVSGWGSATRAGGVVVDGVGLAPVPAGAATAYIEGSDSSVWQISLTPGGSGGFARYGGLVRFGVGSSQ
jgi:hypothetical protein